MDKMPGLENHSGPVVLSGSEVLSILLREDGLSFARRTETGLHVKKVVFSVGEPGEFQRVLASEWEDAEFGQVWVCVPTDRAALVPETMDCPELYEKIMAGAGVAPGTESCILRANVPPDKFILHTVGEKTAAALRERFGENLTFTHPLLVNLRLAASDETILQVDTVEGFANYTLTSENQCLFCDVLPTNSPADILFQMNRIIVGSKIGNCRIVCSGEHADSLHNSLAMHFRDVTLHPDRDDRNLLFPFR